MPKIQYIGPVTQVEFPKGVSERKSSVHLRPGKVVEFTDAELAFIRKAQPVKLAHLRVLPDPKAAPEVKRRRAKAKPPKAQAEKKAQGEGGKSKKK